MGRALDAVWFKPVDKSVLGTCRRWIRLRRDAIIVTEVTMKF
jgi:hypothetical protein